MYKYKRSNNLLCGGTINNRRKGNELCYDVDECFRYGEAGQTCKINTLTLKLVNNEGEVIMR